LSAPFEKKDDDTTADKKRAKLNPTTPDPKKNKCEPSPPQHGLSDVLRNRLMQKAMGGMKPASG
jgi:hypothetical protein